MELIKQVRSNSKGAWFLGGVGFTVIVVALLQLRSEPEWNSRVFWQCSAQLLTLSIALWAAYQNELPHKIRIFRTNTDMVASSGCDAHVLTFIAQSLGPKKEQIALFLIGAEIRGEKKHGSELPIAVDRLDDAKCIRTAEAIVLPGEFGIQLRAIGVLETDVHQQVMIVLHLVYLWPWSRKMHSLLVRVKTTVHFHAERN